MPLPRSRFAEDEGGSGDAAVDDDGNTLLHIAAASPLTTYAAAMRLMAMGHGPNTANNSAADTPMHVAAKSGNVEVGGGRKL